MFQNIISSQVKQEQSFTRRIDIKNLFKLNDIILYAVAFLISMVSFDGDLAPFGIAIFAAACSNRIPVGVLYIFILAGTFIGFGVSGVLTFLLTSLLLIAMMLIFRPRMKESGRNEIQKLGIYLGIAVFAVQACKMFLDIFLIYDLIVSGMLAIITYIFYKIFSNSLIVISEYGIKKAFSIEEVIGASLIFSIALCAFKKVYIMGFSITNILSIMIVLFLGWKNGMLVGGTAGITIGMVLGIINTNAPLLVASYAISGMIAGILNKLGKIGVVLGFCIGNAILTYVVNGNTVPIITIREILIASLGLLAIPKKVRLDITDIISDTRCLPAISGSLEEKKKTANKLNKVSETIMDMAKSYSESAKKVLNKENTADKSKENFAKEVIDNLEAFKENLLYQDVMSSVDDILDESYTILEKNGEIRKNEFITILENVKKYKLGVPEDSTDVMDIVKVLNKTYEINKMDTILKQKEASNKKVLANQLGGVSKVISSIAEDITEQKEKEEKKEKEKYTLVVGSATATKNKSEISGDSNTKTKLNDGKYMIAISDGMGSGQVAKKSSTTVINMLEKLLKTGFDNDISIGLINSAVNLNSNEETYATIDISIIDLNSGNIEFVKNGAAPTFVKTKDKVEVVKAVSFPAGILDKIDMVVYDKDLKENDIIVMCSDGIIESNTEYNNKEIWLKDILTNITTTDVQKIADIILQEAIDNGYGVAKDDMTVIVAKLNKTK